MLPSCVGKTPTDSHIVSSSVAKRDETSHHNVVAFCSLLRRSIHPSIYLRLDPLSAVVAPPPLLVRVTFRKQTNLIVFAPDAHTRRHTLTRTDAHRRIICYVCPGQRSLWIPASAAALGRQSADPLNHDTVRHLTVAVVVVSIRPDVFACCLIRLSLPCSRSFVVY